MRRPARKVKVMSKEEVINPKKFKHGCTCGGHAWRMNGRDPKQPHTAWCPQREEYAEWYAANHIDGGELGSKSFLSHMLLRHFGK